MHTTTRRKFSFYILLMTNLQNFRYVCFSDFYKSPNDTVCTVEINNGTRFAEIHLCEIDHSEPRWFILCMVSSGSVTTYNIK